MSSAGRAANSSDCVAKPESTRLDCSSPAAFWGTSDAKCSAGVGRAGQKRTHAQETASSMTSSVRLLMSNRLAVFNADDQLDLRGLQDGGSRRNPLRSRRALLTHRAPPLDSGVEAVTRHWVSYADPRNHFYRTRKRIGKGPRDGAVAARSVRGPWGGGKENEGRFPRRKIASFAPKMISCDACLSLTLRRLTTRRRRSAIG
jgi:hypothetical protein